MSEAGICEAQYGDRTPPASSERDEGGDRSPAHGPASPNQRANTFSDSEPSPAASESLCRNAVVALEDGDVDEARRVIEQMVASKESAAQGEEWLKLRDITEWSDAWLVAAVRREPPDEESLNVLADRYWKSLFARCQMLTLNREKASDLAQQAWCRVLRVRHTLKPDGNFPAYLNMVATNLWRDAHRAALRAGAMAENRLASLDLELHGDDGESVLLADVVPDLNSLDAEEQQDLAMDLDEALSRLAPLVRDVLVARFITGESCAEIGRRYQRTEQTVSAWVRQGIREIKSYFENSDYASTPRNDL